MGIVQTVVSISLIASGLAILVVIADRMFNNYGPCTLDINEGQRSLKVEGGTTLLNSLASNRIFIPSACGGKATCGLCKIAVGEEAGPLLPTEEPYLSPEELRAGMRLACQVKIKRDLKIRIPEELFSIEQFRARVERITPLTHDIKEFRLNLLEPKSADFKAGQYIQVHSKPYLEVREEVSRAYSLSSLPSEKGNFEIIVRQVPNGVCTTFLHQHLKEGEELTLRGPFGDFYLREGADNLIFIAGGSGLAPIKSLVFDIMEKGLNKKMTFFFGAVSKRDLYYTELFTELEKTNPNFRYIPALSRPAPEDNWTGASGLITDVVRAHIASTESMQAYLCGSPGMLNACVDTLTSIGLPEEDIFFDKFA